MAGEKQGAMAEIEERRGEVSWACAVLHDRPGAGSLHGPSLRESAAENAKCSGH